MAAILVTSVDAYAGKTSVSLGLLATLQKAGLTVGYMKPVGTNFEVIEDQVVDQDVSLAIKMMGLPDSPLDICPILLTQELREKALRQHTSMSTQFMKAYRRIAPGKDAVIIESSGSLSTGYIIGMSSAKIAELTGAKVVGVVRYHRETSPDYVMLLKNYFGDRLAGVLFNYVPEYDRAFIKGKYAECLAHRENIPVLGMLPNDSLLNAVSIADIVNLLGGKVLCREDAKDELVETFTIGAMTPESALRYFSQSRNKAVVTTGDRSDIQIAALQTSTKCIILTDNLQPSHIVLARAAEAGVPMVLVPTDMRVVVEKLEEAFARTRITSPKQIEKITALVANEINIDCLRQRLSI